VVEDDPDVRETVCEMLAVGGFSVHTADNGIAALQALDTSGPFSLVLSDVVMPQMGGFELARRIASRSDSPPIALVSGYAPTTQPGEEELRIPMIAKPFTLKRLLAFVEELVEA
jgi:CheY-like chemotaxis protein